MLNALPDEQRRAILDREVDKYVRKGFRVISRTDTTAQLVKPKSFNRILLLIFGLFSLVGVGIPFLLGYIIGYAVLVKDQSAYLTVDERGHVHARK